MENCGRIICGTPDSGPHFIFVHGWGSCKEMWLEIIANLPQPCYAVAVDLPGTGETPDIPNLTMTALSEWMVHALDCLGMSRVNIVGHSLGGHIAASFALRFPAHVSHLVLVSAPTSMRTLSLHAYVPLMGRFGSAVLGMHWILNRKLSHHIRRIRYSSTSRTKRIDYMSEQNTPIGLRNQLKALRTTDLDCQDASHFDAPVLVMHGDSDTMVTREASSQWRKIFPHSESATIPGGGHSFFDSEPARFAECVYSFCARSVK